MRISSLSHLFFVFGVLTLCGCKEEKPKQEPRVRNTADSTVEQIEVATESALKEVEKENREATPSFSFPDEKRLLAEEKRRKLISRLRQQTRNFERHQKNVDGKHRHYQNFKPYQASDVSTLPVDRSRILTTDMMIPGVLQTTIDSQFPGRAIVFVPRAVFSPEGDTILIPAASKIVCHSVSAGKQGQTRISLMCKRILTPEGVSISLTKSHAADQMGRTGLSGNVDDRFMEKYGVAFLLSGIGAGTSLLGEILIPKKNADSLFGEATSKAGDNLSKNLGTITAEILEKTGDLKPIISIPAGTRIQIVPSRDIFMRNPPKRKAS